MDTSKVLLTLFLSILFLNIQAQTNFATVTKGTSLKADVDSKSKTITRLAEGDKLIYLGDCDYYYCKVEWKGNIGWVKKHLLEIESKPKVVSEEETNVPEIPDVSSPVENTFTNQSDNTKSTNSFAVYLFLFLLLCILTIGGLAYFSYKLFMKTKILKKEKEQIQLEYKNDKQQTQIKYKDIDDVEVEVAKNKEEVETLQKSQNELKANFHKANETYQKLLHQSKLLKDDLEITEFGVYEPQFDYETSAIYKLKIKDNRDDQKQLIIHDMAVTGGENWSVDGSYSKGKSMIKRQKKLMLRAFNGECDNFMKSVKWNNVTRMEERILKSSEIISKMGDSYDLKISSEIVELKLLELRLTYETEVKKHEEKEIQREIREKIRDEQKAIKEYEKAQKDAAREEKLLHDALKIAKEQIEKASTAEKALYESRFLELKEKLKIAEEKNQRAISMAQQTKAGHVYVISNIGSFGENIYKIGMTRRLEPLDRVYELGNASVPFRFDIHAMIYSDNAPELESQLHAQFDKYRLNHVNRRREYFEVSLEEIEKVVKANNGEIEFKIEAEAKEYRESLVIRDRLNSKNKKPMKEVNMEFPKELFT